MANIRDAFESISGSDMFRRVDASHPLDLYCGMDSQFHYALLLVSVKEPPRNLVSSKVISVALNRRKDQKWTLMFSLTEDSYGELFFRFCSDIIESSRVLRYPENGPGFIAERYRNWQQMLAESRTDLLSMSEVKGLIGEMLCLKEILFPLYGQRTSVNAWIGPGMAAQDFVFSDTWYEVKATTSRSTEIQISSVEQLDSTTEGTLVVMALDKTSPENAERITINGLYRRILNSLDDDSLKSAVSRMLFQAGYYPRPEYDENAYQLHFIEQYRVSADFPCLRRAAFPDAVGNARYSLVLPAIKGFVKERTSYGH